VPESLSFLAALRGWPSLLIVCGLLLAEEAGLPLPFAPGEVILIAGGLLVASGALPVWEVVPAEYVAVVLGCLIGFGWSRAIGPDRLRRLAEMVRASRSFDRVSARLQGVGTAGIGVSRLIPGLRVYTTLVSGAVGIGGRRFVVAILPAVAIWVLVYTALGVFFGIPASRLLGRLQNLGVRAALVLAFLAGAYLALRRVPAAHGEEGPHEPSSRGRLAGAVAIDLGLVAVVLALIALLTRTQVRDPEGVVSAVFVVGTISLAYLLVARRSVGYTVGEAILGVRYP
jgi:membrane-associated protein